jgi:predicted GNAT superfamily acetyltransferase
MTFQEAAFVLRVDDDNALIRSPRTAFEYPTAFIEIPYRINALKRSDMEKAQQWQLALRWAMQEAFRQGYVIVDFASQDERSWYVLKRQPQAQE